jgi:hypothetical protein
MGVHMPCSTKWIAAANAGGRESVQISEESASNHYLKAGEARIKHEITLEEANHQKRRAEMLAVRISQQNKICNNMDVESLGDRKPKLITGLIFQNA